MSDKSPIIPILGGAAGAVVAVVGADKLGINPTYAAWGTTAAGALTALGTRGVVSQVATGVGAAGMCLGALQLISSAKVEAAKKTAAHTDHKKRQADSDGHYVTREELNGALSQLADGTKQAHCDLLTALRDEVKRIVVETQHGGDPSLPGTRVDRVPPGAMPIKSPPPPPPGGVPHQYTLYRQAAGEDEYTRNAYGDEERNALYDDERNVSVEDEYTRNAYGFDEERNAYADDEYTRNAYGDDERNAYVDDERNAYVDEERNARGRRVHAMTTTDTGDDSGGLTDEQIAQQQAQMSGGSSM